MRTLSSSGRRSGARLRRGIALLSLILAPGSWAATATATATAPPYPPPPLAQTGFSLRQPARATVVFHGATSHAADAGSASSMVYVMPAGAGLAGLLGAMIAHGGIAEASRQGAITKEQEAADTVLAPYREALAGFSHHDLMQGALDRLSDGGDKKLLSPGDPGGMRWVIESTPAFTMTQDQRALILDNVIIVRDTTLSDPVYQTVVRVVSDAAMQTDPPSVWMTDRGQALRDESVRLYAHSLHILLQSIHAAAEKLPDTPYRTFRYAEGGNDKIERAQLIEHQCSRAVVKTLRGWLMSSPQPRPPGGSEAASAPSDTDDACKTAPAYAM